MSNIDAILAETYAAHPTPGFVAGAVRGGGRIYEAAFGPSDLKGGPPIALDAVFRIASMTKAVTAVAAMQLVEAGRLELDTPLGDLISELGAAQVLDGVDEKGEPRLRAPKRPITLRHLLTHTSGHGYDMWNAELGEYMAKAGIPNIGSGLNISLNLPLMFDPGERWEYGIGIDWAGKAVEAVSGQTLDVYMAEHIFGPLGMIDTAFAPTPSMAARLAGLNNRLDDGGMAPMEFPAPAGPPEFWGGGGGLLSTLGDYLAFLQMVLGEGALNGARVLKPETVALMRQGQLGDVPIRRLPTAVPFLSRDLTLAAAAPADWSLGWLVNREAGPNGRSPESLAWAGLFNTYYWIDPARNLAGALMTQILPFEDPNTLALFAAFERAIYKEDGRGPGSFRIARP